MINALLEWKDRLLGRGEAAITVPVLDGALKSNSLLEDAPVFALVKDAQDLATDGQALFVAAGCDIQRHDLASPGSPPTVVQSFDRPLTALACLPGGRFAVALGGTELRVVGDGCSELGWTEVNGKPLCGVNSVSVSDAGALLVTDGSLERPPDEWKHDLMNLGHTGRLLQFQLIGGRASELASGLGYAFGACAIDREVWISESWRHRVVAIGEAASRRAVTETLPGYPSRLTPAQGGGFWLTCFAMRTQLVEFVLREPAYRKRMMEEIDPRYWIAPAMSSGNTYLEPMQGAQVKTMGVVKPWAPPRSYGLVIRLSADGSLLYSLHSRFDGKHHGIVAAVECRGDLFVLARGCGRILRLSVAACERSLQS